MVLLDFTGIDLKLKNESGKTFVFDLVRRKWVILTPEEHVRQYFLQYLITKLDYSRSLLSIEKQISVNNMLKRFDIVVYNRKHKPWMLVECKSPDIPITDKTFQQLLQYQNNVQCNYWVLTNGHKTLCADASDIHKIKWMNQLPLNDF